MLGNRFIVVIASPVNLRPVNRGHGDRREDPSAIAEQEAAIAQAKVAAALSTRKRAQEQLHVSALLGALCNRFSVDETVSQGLERDSHT